MQRPSVLQIERAFLSAWPALETVADGGWVWRFANGYTKRANSAQSMDPGDEAEIAQRITRYAEWARVRGVPPTFRVTPLAGENVLAALNRLDWRPFEQSLVLAMPVGAAFSPKHKARFFPATDPEWLGAQTELSGYDGDTVTALREMVERIETPSTGVLVFDEKSRPAAAALTNNNAGIAFYNNVIVRSDARGQGYGRSVMQAALNWSRTAGAEWAAIQVVAENAPAVNLYKSLGFEEVYRYHYRRPAQ